MVLTVLKFRSIHLAPLSRNVTQTHSCWASLFCNALLLYLWQPKKKKNHLACSRGSGTSGALGALGFFFVNSIEWGVKVRKKGQVSSESKAVSKHMPFPTASGDQSIAMDQSGSQLRGCWGFLPTLWSSRCVINMLFGVNLSRLQHSHNIDPSPAPGSSIETQVWYDMMLLFIFLIMYMNTPFAKNMDWLTWLFFIELHTKCSYQETQWLAGLTLNHTPTNWETGQLIFCTYNWPISATWPLRSNLGTCC